MILVLGNSAKKVELKDLGDVVYYKQQKSFSDSDYERSQDLKREVKSGRLLILKETKDSTPTNNGEGFDSNQARVYMAQPEPAPAPDPIIIEKEVVVEKEVPVERNDSKLDMLLDKIISLEKKINESPESDKTALMEHFMAGVDEKLEQRLSEINKVPSQPIPEEPKSGDNGLDGKIDMLIDLIKSGTIASSGTSQKVGDYTSSGSTDDVYVPTVSVEDANAKINLKTRIVESGDQVSNALSALKALRNNK